jgi:hypothetical protein
VAGSAVAAGDSGAAVFAGADVGAGEAHPETRTAVVKINMNKILKLDFISFLLLDFSIHATQSEPTIFKQFSNCITSFYINKQHLISLNQRSFR